MRYIRFLKTPRITTEKGTKKPQISCLITITSDLGDSTLPYDADLVAELIAPERNDDVLAERGVQWGAGMRTLSITLPLKNSHTSSILRVRVGKRPKAKHDTFEQLSQPESQGIVSAWSAPFNSNEGKQAVKLVERRFKIAHRTICMWEETGESIARHLWDAGITLSHHLGTLTASPSSPLSTALGLPSPSQSSTLNSLELGTGCGIVGSTLASLLPNCTVTLTDLPEAREIVSRNIDPAVIELGSNSTLSFEELDWDAILPLWLAQSPAEQRRGLDLVLAADCTYNSDSSPALVNTLRRLADAHGKLVVAIAMKMRHESEGVFFDLMDDAGFEETALLEWPLPGDVELGEEKVYLHVYRLEDKA